MAWIEANSMLWMLCIGSVTGPVWMRCTQLVPLWMHARWSDTNDGPMPPKPAWSLLGSLAMASANAGIWATCAHIWPGISGAYWAAFGSVLLLLACIDAISGWLPDVLTLGLLWLGLCASAAGQIDTALPDAVWGAVLGHGILWLTALTYRALTGRDGLGGGDPKLLAAIGAWLGWAAVWPVLFVASLVGALVGGCMQGLGRWPAQAPFPFGPFLALAVPIVGFTVGRGFVVFSWW